MQITIVKACLTQGQAMEAGKSYDVTDKVANELITMGRAVKAAAKPAPKAKKAAKPKANDT